MPGDYNLGTARGRVEIDASGAQAGAAQATRAADTLTGKWSKAAPQMRKIGAGIAGVGVGIAAGLAVAVKSASDFETQISGIAAVSGATGPELDLIRAKALQLGKDTAFSASESAQAMEELVKAGIPLKGVLNGAADATVALAAAGGVDMPTAATIASNAMNQFSLSAEQMPKIADLIAGAANASAIDVGDFGQSMAQAGAVANLAGLSFQDTSVAIAEMGNAGIKGSDAGTSLKTMLSNLQPTTEKQTKLMKQLGLITKDGSNAFYDQTGKLKPLAQIQQALADATDGLSQKQKTMALETIFGSDAIRAAAVLSKSGAKGYNDMNKAMQGTTAADVAKKRMDNLGGSLEQMKGSLETAGIAMGEVLLPYVRKLVDGITGLVNWFLNLSAGTRKTILLVLLIGGAVTLLVGGLILLIGIIAGVVAGLAPLAAALGIGIGALVGFIAVIPLIIAAVVALVVIIIKNWDTIKRVTVEAWNAVKNAVITAWNAVKNAIVTAFNAVVSFLQGVGATLAGWWSGFWNGFVGVVQAIWALISAVFTTYFNIWRTIIQTFISVVLAIWGAFWGVFGGLITAAFGLIVAIVQLGMALLMYAINSVLLGIQAVWNAVWGAISAAAVAVWGFIVNIIRNDVNLIKAVVTRVVNAVMAVVRAVWNVIRSITVSVWNAIYNAVSGPINRARSIVGSVVSTISGAVSRAWNTVKTMTKSAWDALAGFVSGGIKRAMTFVTGMKDKVVGVFKGAGTWLLDAGKNIIQGLIDGVTGMITKFTDKLHALTKLIPKHKGPEQVDKRLLEPNGRWIMQSLISGLSKEIPNLTNMLGGVSMAIPATVVAGAAGALGSPSAATTVVTPSASPSQAMPSRLVLQVGDREFVGYLKDTVKDVQNDSARKVRAGRKGA